MSVDFNLDVNTNDIILDEGITLNSDSTESLAQKIKIALLLRTTEWGQDINTGVPYSQSILQGKNNKTFIDAYYQNYILQIPEVDTITNFQSEVTSDRKYKMSFRATRKENSVSVEVVL